jgi:hypothetical protein
MHHTWVAGNPCIVCGSPEYHVEETRLAVEQKNTKINKSKPEKTHQVLSAVRGEISQSRSEIGNSQGE